ncbi:MAG: type I DNA topoisomerase [Anaerolineaceae bacterium]|nr:type I DNA topoisomerase [Anaerolineaceae bacterium]
MASVKHKLVIVESPAKAKTISRYLGKGYKVEASQGHVCDLPKSQLGIDIDHDFDLKYITIRGRGEILAKIRKEAKNASQIFFATDPDREGEAISWHLFHVLDVPEDQACRIEFNEVTKKAVQAAIKHPRKLDMGRINAQQARRALDRLVGYKISPLLWVKVKKGLSAGRVQSVATRLVVDREKEIEAFVPEEYWDISALCKLTDDSRSPEFTVRFNTLDGEKITVHTKEQAEKALSIIRSENFLVTDSRQKERRRSPAPPFTTSSLQQEASRKLNFTTSRTMQVVQQLYEGIDIAGEGIQGLVTYIRTDSVRVSDEALAAVRKYIPAIFGEAYLPSEKNEYRGRKNAQDAHEAIRPTDVNRTPDSIKSSLTREQFQLYKLIYNRFVASQMASAVYETITADINGKRAGLRFYGEHKVFPGFTVLYEESSDEESTPPESNFPLLLAGQKITVISPAASQHFTQPPSRFTEASLVRTLEENGIGRPSTYAPTISTIISRGYVSREKKRLYPTSLGEMITNMMEQYFNDIVDPDFTAHMEEELDQVEEGTKNWKEVLRDFYPRFDMTLQTAENEIEKCQIQDEISDVNCDLCGAKMVYKMGRYGRFLACPNFPDCRNTKPILVYLDTPCPKCGKRLMEKVSKKGRKFYGCENYPECDFISWDKPVISKCPQCGSYMIEKRNKKGEKIHLCADESCRYKVVIPASEGETSDE